jgi:hypothetical protein
MSTSPGTLTISEAQRARGLVFVRLAVAGVGFALALQMSLNSNFLVDVIGVTGFQAGLLEALRESCGIIAFGILAILAGLKEPIIAFIMLLFVWIGLTAYSAVPSYGLVIVMSLVWSQGLHIWMPLPNSMALSLAEPGRSGARLGQQQAAGAIGSAIGLVAAFVLTIAGVPIRPLYVIAGSAALLAAAACLGIPRNIKTPGPSLVFRKRYLTYYVLCLLEGWRKQIAITFAGFLLVKIYHTPLTVMLVLWVAVQAIGYVLSPRVGKLIDRVGERPILIGYYAGLTVLFVGYAFIAQKEILYAIFVIDGASFAFATALTTYVNRIAPPSEHTPTLSVGVAMNHIAAVAMPFLGGILWSTIGYRWAFLIGLPAAAASIAISATLRRAVPAPAAVASSTP